ncbi:GMC family oxidoreductase [Gordonia sp. NB41Y]|uniref:GMC oxidoreductase n=1 Tax=Gordonia sp. NB41Y TaxID=875808 RepID=UPI00128EBBB5|nr:GMC family oxidoreductase [Gordonia sp. NB41Y]WLP88442.1 GMC family oxidoreductase [Gordonia sp. NB41Y]
MVRTDADVVVIGLGWAGAVVATELARAGMSVLALERGAVLPSEDNRQSTAVGRAELMNERIQRADLETFTLRHNDGYAAQPLRSLGAFLVGDGVGGGGVLWGGMSPRLAEGALSMRSDLPLELAEWASQVGAQFDDWPMAFDELEPDMARFEELIGVSGKAGVIGGVPSSGGNPREGSRSGEYPVVAGHPDAVSQLIAGSARAQGIEAYPIPSAQISVAHTNSYGITRAPWGGSDVHIASPQTTVLPAGLATGNLQVVPHTRVRRLERRSGRVVRAVVDGPDGTYEVRAGAFVLATWSLNNVRTLLLSGIGTPYDPASGGGVVGRNHANHVGARVTGYFPADLVPEKSPFPGIALAEFDPWAWGGGEPFIGGAFVTLMGARYQALNSGQTPPHTGRWGAEWARALRTFRHRVVTLNILGEVVPTRGRYLDLDPRYRDRWGDPLLRLTYDYGENERRLVREVSGRVGEILRAAGAVDVDAAGELTPHYDTVPYQNSHATGGAIMGQDPRTSVVDPHLACWEARNLWVVGSSAFPNAGAANPTVTVGALALRASRAIAGQI